MKTLTNPPASLPEGPLVAYYGDDFTGSTDVMEAFTAAGIPTVLFLTPPTSEDLSHFKNMRCFGIAGQSRGKSPEWMQEELPRIFHLLAQIGAPILQYKVCSTFDSSPTIGSIGKAIDIATRVTKGDWSPMIVGAPRLKRYQVFGQLFAEANGQVHRIDRHPTMSRHPVTPMDEADLRLHLAKQTKRRIELLDMALIREKLAETKLNQIQGDDQAVVLIDVMDLSTQIEAGRLIWENKGDQIFSASSSGLQYALTAYWRERAWIDHKVGLPQAEPVECIAAVSGSCSPMSALQIEWAQKNGFICMPLNIAKVLNPNSREGEIEQLTQKAIAALENKSSTIVYSAKGPDDPEVVNFDLHAAENNLNRTEAANQIGQVLAEIMRRILEGSDVKRIVVAGGDSSGAVGSYLDIRALTVIAGIAPGVPLCKAWSEHAKRDGLEIALKGGQLGGIEFY